GASFGEQSASGASGILDILFLLCSTQSDRNQFMSAAPKRPGSDPRLAVPAAIEPAPIAPDRRRGRGSEANRTGRYEPLQRVDVDDGWATLAGLPPLQTEVQV